MITRSQMLTGGLGAAAMLALAATALPGAPATAQSRSSGMLASLERGAWELRPRGGGETRRICMRSASDLIQLRHAGRSGCNRYVVEESANMVTVQYTCRGAGYGRTSIRREKSGLVQIESQGIANERPFQFTAEARHAGACR